MTTQPTTPPGEDVVFILTVKDHAVKDHAVVEIWQREGRSGGELASMLRQIADGFEHGDVTRLR